MNTTESTYFNSLRNFLIDDVEDMIHTATEFGDESEVMDLHDSLARLQRATTVSALIDQMSSLYEPAEVQEVLAAAQKATYCPGA